MPGDRTTREHAWLSEADSVYLRLERVSFRYRTGFALHDIELAIPPRSFVGLVGPNGSGKSTLLRVLSGIIVPHRGRITLNDRPLEDFTRRQLARRLAVISADQHFQFPFLVEDVVAMGRYAYLQRRQSLSTEDQAIVEEAMVVTQTEGLRRRAVSDLSSGERQRVLIARAIAQQPQVLLLDEPEAHLDINHQVRIFRLLRQLNSQRGITIIAAVHDLAAALTFCGSLVLLQQGRVARQGPPPDVIDRDTLQAVYGVDFDLVRSPLDAAPLLRYRDHGPDPVDNT